MLKQLTIFSIILAICALVYTFRVNRTLSELRSQVSSLKEELTQKEKIVPASASPEYSPDSYDIKIVQLGGSGSMIDQVWTLVENGEAYLNPSTDWATLDYNRIATASWVSCKNGYQVKECTLNREPIDDIRKDLGCFVNLQNTPLRNDILVKCEKE